MNNDNTVTAVIGWVIAIAIVIIAITILAKSIRIIPQAASGVVERLGKYHKTLLPGLNILVPFIDRLRPLIDMREQVVSFPPQPVITEDNLVVSIDTVVYFQVTDARAATYEIANYLGAVEQLTTTTLRNVVGGLNLEEALTSRDNINGQLRLVLDEATGKWGIRVSRVELKAIDPPLSIQDSMEKQMRAERDRRAAILTAEGTKQSAILEAEGARQAEILRAEGNKQAAVLIAQGEAEAITTVFNAIHVGEPDDKLLAYQYLQMLPKISEGASNKLWIIPSELTEALKGIGGAFTPKAGGDAPEPTPAVTTRRRAAAAAAAESDAVKLSEEAKSEAAAVVDSVLGTAPSVADLISQAQSADVNDGLVPPSVYGLSEQEDPLAPPMTGAPGFPPAPPLPPQQ